MRVKQLVGRPTSERVGNVIGRGVSFIAIIILSVTLMFTLQDDMLIYFTLCLRDQRVAEPVPSTWTESKVTGVAQEGTVDVASAGATGSGGQYNADSIGYFGAMWFWIEYETSRYDITAFDKVCTDDGAGGQAYGIQYDLFQGSLQNFMRYCLEKDSQKYSMFAPLVNKQPMELFANLDGTGIMPDAWHAAFNTDPEGFAQLQKDCLIEDYATPAFKQLEDAGYNIYGRAETVRGAILSFVHQHGVSSCGKRCMQNAGITNADSDEEFIRKLYAWRIKWRGNWGGLDLAYRYRNELQTALNLLKEEQSVASSSGISTDVPGAGADKPFDGTFTWPTPSCTATSSVYGWRIHPIYGTNKFHAGEDIPAQMSAEILAAASGTVTIAGWVSGYGNYTKIDHGNGIETAYGHQSSILVTVGQKVTKGQLIGKVGSTGNSTGPHLHFEVYQNGKTIDPKSCTYS